VALGRASLDAVQIESAPIQSSPGARFWGQVRGLSGLLRALEGKGAASGETGQMQGKGSTKRGFPDQITASESSMVRRGSAVRVRQRALLSQKYLQVG
jgi:hypothetical protein